MGLFFLVTALTLAAPLPAQPNISPGAPDYSKDSTWLCLPERADTCSTSLPTTELKPAGYGATGRSVVAKDPPLDCFYVYQPSRATPA